MLQCFLMMMHGSRQSLCFVGAEHHLSIRQFIAGGDLELRIASNCIVESAVRILDWTQQ